MTVRCEHSAPGVTHGSTAVAQKQLTCATLSVLNTVLLEEYQAFLDPTAPHPKADLFHEFHSNESGDPEAVLMHALGHWRISEGFHDLVWHPAVTVATAQLLEQPAPDASQEEEEEQQQLQRVRLWHDQLFAKPAHHGGGVAW